MNRRVAIVALCAVLVGLPAIAGCGSGNGDDTSTTATPAGESTRPEQSYNGFPGAGNPNAPDVTTTAGKAPPVSKGPAGGGTGGGTCIGC